MTRHDHPGKAWTQMWGNPAAVKTSGADYQQSCGSPHQANTVKQQRSAYTPSTTPRSATSAASSSRCATTGTTATQTCCSSSCRCTTSKAQGQPSHRTCLTRMLCHARTTQMRCCQRWTESKRPAAARVPMRHPERPSSSLSVHRALARGCQRHAVPVTWRGLGERLQRVAARWGRLSSTWRLSGSRWPRMQQPWQPQGQVQQQAGRASGITDKALHYAA
mmetsp:Transcript_32425/g.82370  ORF Transcript_32425/g.82370 Transcript_32425/m.82370 type:complete len:220 (+) Transcript_32425:234-893(+)